MASTDLAPITSTDQLTDEDRRFAVAHCVKMAENLRDMARMWDDLAFEIEFPERCTGDAR